MAIVLENVLDDWLGSLTTEGAALYALAEDVLNFILNIVYSVALFMKDFVVDHTMWFVFLIILGALFAFFKRKTYKIWM